MLRRVGELWFNRELGAFICQLGNVVFSTRIIFLKKEKTRRRDRGPHTFEEKELTPPPSDLGHSLYLTHHKALTHSCHKSCLYVELNRM